MEALHLDRRAPESRPLIPEERLATVGKVALIPSLRFIP